MVQEIIEQDLMAQTEQVGAQLKAELEQLINRYPFIGDVRGKGLLLAFETVADRETMEPLPPEWMVYHKLIEYAYERGLIIYSRRTRDGIAGDHFMICPPMITTTDQLGEILEPLKDSLDELAAELNLPVNRSVP